MTDHYLLMTATPHKGDPENFRLFLELLDRDVYGNVKSLEEAMRRHEAPFYLRRTKEALVTFPDPETGEVQKLFTKREVRTAAFELDGDEFDFYDALTRYVEDQSIKAAAARTAPAAAPSASRWRCSSAAWPRAIYAVRRSLERMRDKRQRDPRRPREAYRQEQIDEAHPRRLRRPDRGRAGSRSSPSSRTWSLSVDPVALREEIAAPRQAHRPGARPREARDRVEADQAQAGPDRAAASSATREMKLLVFTEHKDTLDYLAGDGQRRPAARQAPRVGPDRHQIHGGMKIGDRDTPGTRIYAEREFREDCPGPGRHRGRRRRHQPPVLLADDQLRHPVEPGPARAADGPHPPLRPGARLPHLQLRRGEHARGPRAGEAPRPARGDPERAGHRQGVRRRRRDLPVEPAGEAVPRHVRPADSTSTTSRTASSSDVDPERFRQITESTLEGLAKRELNLSAIVGKSAEAKERRLVPEVIEDFFVAGRPRSPASTRQPVRGKEPRLPRRQGAPDAHPDRRTPGARFGRLGREYQRVVFDKALAQATTRRSSGSRPATRCSRRSGPTSPTASTTTCDAGPSSTTCSAKAPYRLDVFAASIKDGRGNHAPPPALRRRDRRSTARSALRQPTIFHDLTPAPKGTPPRHCRRCPTDARGRAFLFEQALKPFLAEVVGPAREREPQSFASTSRSACTS